MEEKTKTNQKSQTANKYWKNYSDNQGNKNLSDSE
jgi:hypothetical protein